MNQRQCLLQQMISDESCHKGFGALKGDCVNKGHLPQEESPHE